MEHQKIRPLPAEFDYNYKGGVHKTLTRFGRKTVRKISPQ